MDPCGCDNSPFDLVSDERTCQSAGKVLTNAPPPCEFSRRFDTEMHHYAPPQCNPGAATMLIIVYCC